MNRANNTAEEIGVTRIQTPAAVSSRQGGGPAASRDGAGRMNSPAAVAWAAAVFFFAGVTATAAEAELVARVNGAGVPRTTFERNLKSIYVKRGLLDTTAKKRGIYDSLRDQVLDQLVDEELLYQYAKSRGLAPEKSFVAEKISGIRASFPSPAAFTAYLKKSFFTEETLGDFTERQMALENLAERELAENIRVSEEEIHEYYIANIDKYSTPEKVRARHILIHVKPDAAQEVKDDAMKRMKEILGRAGSEADFVELAKKYSECPSAKRGGDLGFFTRGQMSQPFEAAAFTLKPGEISGVVVTDYGYHILRVEESVNASVKPEAGSEPEIRELLETHKKSLVAREFAKQLRSSARVEILLTAQP